MTLQTYFGLNNDENAWVLVQRNEGETVFLERFNNTMDGLNELSMFIRNWCKKPRVYVKSTDCSAPSLLKCLCSIPDIEVMFVSQAGFKQYQTCLPESIVKSFKGVFCEAEILADCAEYMN